MLLIWENIFPDEYLRLATFLKENEHDYEEDHDVETKNNKKKRFEPEAKKPLKFLISCLESMFPNRQISLCIFFSMVITNFNDEKSFSALKRVKNYLCSTSQEIDLWDLLSCFLRVTS